MKILPFQGLRPSEKAAARVASPPYDVVSAREARDLAAGNPLSMLRVVRAEIDFPEGTDPRAGAVYAKAAENLRRLAGQGHLQREKQPCLYLYQQQMGAHVQRGLAALCRTGDYDNGLIKKHEKTRRDKEDDRTRLTSELSANPGPVFLTYKDVPALAALLEPAAASAPLLELTDEKNVRHTVWRITETAPVLQAFEAVPRVYIADGHHRAASAARVGRERRQANPRHTGHEAYNGFLCVLFPASHLQILPYNRAVRDLNGMSPGALIEKLKKTVPVSENAPHSPRAPGQVSFYLAGKWHGLELKAEDNAGPAARLDAQMLQERILGPLLGVGDPRTSERIEFIGGIRGPEELERKVNQGEAAIAFSMYPATVNQLMGIADAGEIMPPKSTWFEPKLRSGLFIHTFEPRS